MLELDNYLEQTLAVLTSRRKGHIKEFRGETFEAEINEIRQWTQSRLLRSRRLRRIPHVQNRGGSVICGKEMEVGLLNSPPSDRAVNSTAEVNSILSNQIRGVRSPANLFQYRELFAV